MYAQAAAHLANIQQVACVTCQLINIPFIVGQGVVVFQRFVPVGYGISAFECYLDICVSEYVCDRSYLWGNVGECYPSPFLCLCLCALWCA